MCFALAEPTPARSAEGLSLIRDAEIEDTIHLYATPLFEAAGLDPESIEIHLVADDALNAFVANGRHMFLFSGLLMESEDPGLVIGVIAHETGHLAAGHLVRVREAHEDASAMVLLSTLLGVAVGVAGGVDAGAAIATVGSQLAPRDFFRFSRAQESIADQAGLRYLEAIGQSAEGFAALMETLARDEPQFGTASEIPYFLTHPSSRERLHTIKAHIARSRFTGKATDPRLAERQRRVVAKLYGFLAPPRAVHLRYPEGDASIHARYARAVAAFRQRLLVDALALMDGLIAEEPANPYFYELRGQMLYETGDVAAALPSYRRAVGLLPEQPLLRAALARALLKLDAADAWREALHHLDVARRREGDDPVTWNLLGEAHGKLGETALSDVARAEMHYLRGEPRAARRFAERALENLRRGSPEWLRADDIVAASGGE